MNVLTESDGKVRTITINRPAARNAVDATTAAELAAAFRDFEADDSAAVAVLCGAGGTFCAGADLKAIAAGNPNRVDPDMRADAPMGPTRMDPGKPVIAAIAGHAVAGGLELACWCDLRVVERDAVLGVFCRRFGVPLVDGGTQRLPRLIGLSRALDMILTGRPVSAEEALTMGLANRLVEPGGARAEAQELARELAALPQACLRSDRLAARSGQDMSLADGMALETLLGLRVIESGESRDGAARFSHGAGRHGGPGSLA